jgi:isoleucyl-tRNA synthetase
MISNANPWDNLKFDSEGISEVRNKLFGTLYNTYSFFSLYANLDNFEYLEEDISIEKRPELDRWILSELNTLIRKTDEYYDDYEPTKATRAIADFVLENLSNWYVRLGRRRYWKGKYNEDKISAYQTLYTCLETIAKLCAPVAPFYSEHLYRDLTKHLRETVKKKKNIKKSVHLTEFPVADENLVDNGLERKMKKAQTISSLVLSLRQKEKLKVRQPLQKIMIPVLNASEQEEILAVSELIKREVNVKEIELINEDNDLLVKQIKPDFKVLGPRFGKEMKQIAQLISEFGQQEIATLEREGEIEVFLNKKSTILALSEVIITSQDIEGWLVANYNGTTVALDIHVTPELKNEGIARELVNRIQNLRKDSGFEVTDRIEITIQEDNMLNEAVKNNIQYIKEETLANTLEFVASLPNGTEITFDGIKTYINIKKV